MWKNAIESMAAKIMKTGVKFKDPYHVTLAVYTECEYFNSTDMRLLKYKTDQIKMVTPDSYKHLRAHETTHNLVGRLLR